MDIRSRFGITIRKIRLEKGFSQEILALRANLHRTYISDIERGERNVSLDNIHKLAMALGITLEFLFTEMEKEL